MGLGFKSLSSHFAIWHKYIIKDVNFLQLISKKEAFAMREILGVNSVVMSHSRKPKYYLIEDKKNLAALDEYRKSIVVK